MMSMLLQKQGEYKRVTELCNIRVHVEAVPDFLHDVTDGRHIAGEEECTGDKAQC